MNQLSHAELVQFSTTLIRIVERMVGNSASAEDLVQETLIAALESPRYQAAPEKEDQKRILIRIATNKAIDWLRRPANNPQINQPFEILVEEGREPPCSYDAELQHAQNEALSRVERILQKRPHRDRAVALWSHLFEERPAEEVAEQAGCSVRQFYSWLAEFRVACKNAAPSNGWMT